MEFSAVFLFRDIRSLFMRLKTFTFGSNARKLYTARLPEMRNLLPASTVKCGLPLKFEIISSPRLGYNEIHCLCVSAKFRKVVSCTSEIR